MKPGEHAPNCSVTDRALKENSRRRHCTITLRRKSGRLFSRDVVDGKENETPRDHFARISLEIEMCTGMCKADSDCTHTSFVQNRQFFIEFTIKSAMKLVVEPPATVGLGLCSAAIHDVSCDYLFTALELSALNSWLARTARTWFAR